MPFLNTIFGSLPKFIDNLFKNKQYIVIFVLVTIALGAILFFPSTQKFSLDILIRKYGLYFYLAFIILFILCVCVFCNYLIDIYQKSCNRKKLFKSLTPEEQSYLAPYIIDEKNSVSYALNDGIIQGLSLKGIVYRSTKMGDNYAPFNFDYNLQDWAREYLNKNRYLLNNGIDLLKEKK